MIDDLIVRRPLQVSHQSIRVENHALRRCAVCARTTAHDPAVADQRKASTVPSVCRCAGAGGRSGAGGIGVGRAGFSMMTMPMSVTSIDANSGAMQSLTAVTIVVTVARFGDDGRFAVMSSRRTSHIAPTLPGNASIPP